MARLSVNIDTIAALRRVGNGRIPDPKQAAVAAELAGVNGIAIRIGPDQLYDFDRDVVVLKNLVQTHLNIRIAPSDPMFDRVLELKPQMITLIPPQVKDVSAMGGLDIEADYDFLVEFIPSIQERDILVTLLLEPEVDMVKRAAKLKADYVELFTLRYAKTENAVKAAEELEKLSSMAALASKLLMGVSGGYGLGYRNINQVFEIREFEEFVVGHSIFSRSIYVGIEQAVKEILTIIKE
jgi:pyridoxine 5-phosphate synthase